MAGADIAYMQSNQKKGDQAAMRAYMDNSNSLLNLIEDGPKPAVAAITGFALGGGLELAMVCFFFFFFFSVHTHTLLATQSMDCLLLGLQRSCGCALGSARSA